MAFDPRYTITPSILERFGNAITMRGAVIRLFKNLQHQQKRQLQSLTLLQNARSVMLTEGVACSLEQILAAQQGRPTAFNGQTTATLCGVLAALRLLRHPKRPLVNRPREGGKILHEDVIALHRMVVPGFVREGRLGMSAYRNRDKAKVWNRHSAYPPAKDVPKLMNDLLEWWNEERAKKQYNPFRHMIIHHQLESIAPFPSGNLMVARALALWEMRRNEWDAFGGWDPQQILAAGDYFCKNRRIYAAQLDSVRVDGETDLTGWLEYNMFALCYSLDLAIKKLKLALEQQSTSSRALSLIQETGTGGITPAALRNLLMCTKQNVALLLRPLVAEGLVERRGTGHSIRLVYHPGVKGGKAKGRGSKVLDGGVQGLGGDLQMAPGVSQSTHEPLRNLQRGKQLAKQH